MERGRVGYYAFEALNMPEDHPARDEWETFFIRKTRRTSGEEKCSDAAPHRDRCEMRAAVAEGRSVRMLNIAKTYRRQMDIRICPCSIN